MGSDGDGVIGMESGQLREQADGWMDDHLFRVGWVLFVLGESLVDHLVDLSASSE